MEKIKATRKCVCSINESTKFQRWRLNRGAVIYLLIAMVFIVG